MIQRNPSKFDERLFSDIYLCRLLRNKGGKKTATKKKKQQQKIKIKINTGFYVLRQGVPEGHSSEGYASFKQA